MPVKTGSDAGWMEDTCGFGRGRDAARDRRNERTSRKVHGFRGWRAGQCRPAIAGQGTTPAAAGTAGLVIRSTSFRLLRVRSGFRLDGEGLPGQSFVGVTLAGLTGFRRVPAVDEHAGDDPERNGHCKDTKNQHEHKTSRAKTAPQRVHPPADHVSVAFAASTTTSPLP